MVRLRGCLNKFNIFSSMIHKNENEDNNRRNSGIDLLRVLSMFFVVLLHSLGQGGILSKAIVNSHQYKIAWFMEICAYCAVDIFALISGYVSYTEKEKSVKYLNYIKLWLEVVFYDLIITIIFNIFMPSVISYKDYINSVLPITNKYYWYFTAYTGLFMIMPILNKGIRNCSSKTLRKLFVVIIFVFSFWDLLSHQFFLSSGASLIWIILLYILGATIKKCEIGKNMKTYKIVLGILFLNIFTYLYKMYGFSFQILNISISKDIFISYSSPTVLISAILYIIIFSRMKFNTILGKTTRFMGVSAFSIYLINQNKLVWDNIIKNLFTPLARQSSIKMCVYILGFTFIFVVGSILVDKIRIFLFKVCKIDKLADRMEKLFQKLITKVSEFI